MATVQTLLDQYPVLPLLCVLGLFLLFLLMIFKKISTLPNLLGLKWTTASLR